MATSFVEMLSEEHQALQSLLELMQQEQKHLVQADIEALAALTETKNQLVLKMNRHTSTRNAALQQAGFTADNRGMRAALDQQHDAQAEAGWQQLLAAGKQANEINRVNGLLINKHMVRTHGALNALQRSTPAGNVYGRDGQAKGLGTPRRLVIG